jgi:hypothetical protein
MNIVASQIAGLDASRKNRFATSKAAGRFKGLSNEFAANGVSKAAFLRLLLP